MCLRRLPRPGWSPYHMAPCRSGFVLRLLRGPRLPHRLSSARSLRPPSLPFLLSSPSFPRTMFSPRDVPGSAIHVRWLYDDRLTELTARKCAARERTSPLARRTRRARLSTSIYPSIQSPLLTNTEYHPSMIYVCNNSGTRTSDFHMRVCQVPRGLAMLDGLTCLIWIVCELIARARVWACMSLRALCSSPADARACLIDRWRT